MASSSCSNWAWLGRTSPRCPPQGSQAKAPTFLPRLRRLIPGRGRVNSAPGGAVGGSQDSPAVTSGSPGMLIHLDACRDASEQLRRDPGSLGRFPSPRSRQERRFTAARARGCAGAPVSRLHTRLSANRPHGGPAAPAIPAHAASSRLSPRITPSPRGDSPRGDTGAA